MNHAVELKVSTAIAKIIYDVWFSHAFYYAKCCGNLFHGFLRTVFGLLEGRGVGEQYIGKLGAGINYCRSSGYPTNNCLWG